MTLAYGDMPLDRCTNQRKNRRWLVTEFNHQDTLFCVINAGMSLFEQGEIFSPLYLNKSQLPTLTVDTCIYLGKGSLGEASLSKGELAKNNFDNNILDEGGLHNNTPEVVSIFAIDYNKLRFSTQEELNNSCQWQELRKVTANLSAINASILAMAKGLVHWHISHQFCGQCGNHNCSVEAGHARRCSDCRNMSFPRTDPAVIMLVEKKFSDGVSRCLLGRQANWAQGMYSTLAGFVDPGETLEQAVIREVVEETAILVEKPHYIASQPWPFPASIMLGFTVVATSEKIDISQDDLEDARWFSREQLSQFALNIAATGKSMINKEEQVFRMSSSDSISSYLITAWLNKEIGQY